MAPNYPVGRTTLNQVSRRSTPGAWRFCDPQAERGRGACTEIAANTGLPALEDT